MLRRDFSINALAYDGENIYYLEKSFEDLQAQKSFLSEPDDRIKEDPFRIPVFLDFIRKSLFVSMIKTLKKKKKV